MLLLFSGEKKHFFSHGYFLVSSKQLPEIIKNHTENKTTQIQIIEMFTNAMVYLGSRKSVQWLHGNMAIMSETYVSLLMLRVYTFKFSICNAFLFYIHRNVKICLIRAVVAFIITLIIMTVVYQIL